MSERKVVTVTNSTGLPVPLADRQLASGETADIEVDETTQRLIDAEVLTVTEKPKKGSKD